MWPLCCVLLCCYLLGCSLSKAVVSMQVQERHSGKMIDETVPSYLRSVYRVMYQNPVGRKLIKFPVTTSLLRRATARHGVKMDDPQSAEQIETFIATYGVNVDEVELSLESYPTFNDFFARKLKAGVRPIASEHDDSILVAPADCRLLVYPSIEDTTKIWLKGQDFTIASLLGPKFKDQLKHFHNPAIAIARLAPQDYHRWHMPAAATVGAREAIAGTYFSVSPRAVREVNILCTNKREVCMFDSELYGKWSMTAVGAAMVSSIIISDDMVEGKDVAKGAEHGWFKFGGSTLILLFDSHKVVWDDDLIEASRKPIETYVKVGTRIGRYRKGADAAGAQTTTKPGRKPVAVSLGTCESPPLCPTSPSLIHTATTDAARKEARLNDEGLLNDCPVMQSNLTLLEAPEDGDTEPARGVPHTTSAKSNAAEAAGGDISGRRGSVGDLFPSFFASTDDLLDSESSPSPSSSASCVPAPAVFHLVHFAGDDDDEEGEASSSNDEADGAEKEADDEEMEVADESTALMADVSGDSASDSGMPTGGDHPDAPQSLTASTKLARKRTAEPSQAAESEPKLEPQAKKTKTSPE